VEALDHLIDIMAPVAGASITIALVLAIVNHWAHSRILYWVAWIAAFPLLVMFALMLVGLLLGVR
jgi:hypothetical protein